MNAPTRIFPLLALFLFLAVCSWAQKKKPATSDYETDCLQVTGKFDETMKSLEGKYTVKVLRDNKTVEEQTLKVKQGFKFVLKKGVMYTVKIEKEGYIPRLLSVSTKLPEKFDLDSHDLFKFHFETNLIDEAFYHHFDDDDVDFPIALVAYSKRCDCFEYDKKYTQELMSRLIGKIMAGGY